MRDLLKPLHLLDQRRDVLEPRLSNLVAQRDQLRVVVDELATLRGAFGLHRAVYARQHLLLLRDDGLHLAV